MAIQPISIFKLWKRKVGLREPLQLKRLNKTKKVFIKLLLKFTCEASVTVNLPDAVGSVGSAGLRSRAAKLFDRVSKK